MTWNLGGADAPPLAHISTLIEWILWTWCRIYDILHRTIFSYYTAIFKCHQNLLSAPEKSTQAELIYSCQKVNSKQVYLQLKKSTLLNMTGLSLGCVCHNACTNNVKVTVYSQCVHVMCAQTELFFFGHHHSNCTTQGGE